MAQLSKVLWPTLRWEELHLDERWNVLRPLSRSRLGLWLEALPLFSPFIVLFFSETSAVYHALVKIHTCILNIGC